MGRGEGPGDRAGPASMVRNFGKSRAVCPLLADASASVEPATDEERVLKCCELIRDSMQICTRSEGC